MKRLTLSALGIALAASAAHAQPASAGPDAAADGAGDARAETAGPAAPAGAATAVGASTAGQITDAEIDSFAKATVRLRAIQADTSIAADQKQAQMQAAVTAAGLDAAKYNAISKAAAADATLRAKVQTAMSKHTQPGEG